MMNSLVLLTCVRLRMPLSATFHTKSVTGERPVPSLLPAELSQLTTLKVNLSILILFLRITKVVFVAMAARGTIMKKDALGLGPRVSLSGSTPRQCSVAFLRTTDL